MRTLILLVIVLSFYGGCRATLILSDLIDGKNSFETIGYISQYYYLYPGNIYDIQGNCSGRKYLNLFYCADGIEASYVLKNAYDEFTVKLEVVLVDAITFNNALRISFNGQPYNINNNELRTGEKLYDDCGAHFYEDFSYEFAMVFQTLSKTNVINIAIKRAMESPANFYIRNLRIYESKILKNPEEKSSIKILTWAICAITFFIIIMFFWILYRKNEKFANKVKSMIDSMKKLVKKPKTNDSKALSIDHPTQTEPESTYIDTTQLQQQQKQDITHLILHAQPQPVTQIQVQLQQQQPTSQQPVVQNQQLAIQPIIQQLDTPIQIHLPPNHIHHQQQVSYQPHKYPDLETINTVVNY